MCCRKRTGGQSLPEAPRGAVRRPGRLRRPAGRPCAARAAAGTPGALKGSGEVMCGVFGIFAPGRDVARLTFFGLYALQHRGQESAGIAVRDDGRITAVRDMGLVSQVFDEPTLSSLTGQAAIGHVRYSTTGSSSWENAQPLVHEHHGFSVALGHNGNLLNAGELRAELLGQACASAAARQRSHGGAHRRPGRHRPGRRRARRREAHARRVLGDRADAARALWLSRPLRRAPPGPG